MPRPHDEKGTLKLFSAQVNDSWRYLLHEHALDVPNRLGVKPSDLEPFAAQVPLGVDRYKHVYPDAEKVKASLCGLGLEIGYKVVNNAQVRFVKPITTQWLTDRVGLRSFEGGQAVFRSLLWRAYALLCDWGEQMHEEERLVSFGRYLDEGVPGSRSPRIIADGQLFLLTHQANPISRVKRLIWPKVAPMTSGGVARVPTRAEQAPRAKTRSQPRPRQHQSPVGPRTVNDATRN